MHNRKNRKYKKPKITIHGKLNKITNKGSGPPDGYNLFS